MIFDGSFSVLDRAQVLYLNSCHYAMQTKGEDGSYFFDPLMGEPVLAIRGDNFLCIFEIGADVPKCFLGEVKTATLPLNLDGLVEVKK